MTIPSPVGLNEMKPNIAGGGCTELYRCSVRHIRPGSRGDWQKTSTFVPAIRPSVSAAFGGIGLWGEKVDNGVDGYGEWWNVGLHKFSANLRVAQATLAAVRW